MADDGPKHGAELHFGFIEMLFALAAAEVAIKAGQFVDDVTQWDASYFAVASHLVLATVVIAASWVGWGSSKFARKDSELGTIFSLDFLKLLMDVGLVVAYFILAHSVEKLVIDPQTKTISFIPSAVPEFRWVTVIIAAYFFWDIVSKVKQPRFILTRGWASAVCLVLVILLWILVVPQATSGVGAVICIDLSLLGLVVLFRAMKMNDLDKTDLRQWITMGICFVFMLAFGFASNFV
ncbi:MAG: hypothetical protein SFU86_10010 [Pirellulaceae bacterium]|nr:hypothetical protein [Pirellulaceae bacterium]